MPPRRATPSSPVCWLMDADPRLCLIRVVICSAIIHCDAPDHGASLRMRGTFQAGSRVLRTCPCLSLGTSWRTRCSRPSRPGSPGGQSLELGATWAQCHPWTPRTHAGPSVCLHWNHASTPCGPSVPRHPNLCPRGPSRPPSTPGSATCLRLPGPHRPSAAGNPFQKQRLRWCPRHISECHNSALARQGAGRACGHSESGGPGSGPAGLGVVMAGMGGAGVSRGSGDGGPRGLRGSGHLPEVRGVLPECLSQLSPRPLEGAAGCELLC